MSFMLTMAENMLGLTSQEKAVLEPLLPQIKEMIDTLNEAMPDVAAANELYVHAQASIINRVLADYRVIGPNASALLGDGWPDVGGTTTAMKDIQSAVTGNPKTVNSIVDLYNKLVPLINYMQKNWPDVKPGYDVVVAAAKRKGLNKQNFIPQLRLHLKQAADEAKAAGAEKQP